LTDPAEINAQYRRWQRQILISSIIGYAAYYFVRKNLSVAMPVMERDLGIGKSELGLFLTLHGVLYGVSKFANGFLGDRTNARTFMAAGLLLSAIMNVCFGFSSGAIALGVFWLLNGWVQGMGFPPCARLMTHWFSPGELATKMSIWNTSHSIGAGLVVILCGYLVVENWRLCFFIPAILAVLCVGYLLLALRDTPPSVGLPELAGTEAPAGKETGADFKSFLWQHVFTNKFICLLAVANFFVYTIRYAVLDWGPSLLTQAKHVEITHAGWMVAAFELSGVAGMLLGGWITDRVFGGRGGRACLIYMALAGVALFLFWKNPFASQLVNTGLLCCAGFFIYGPQALVGITAANLATKRAAATAIGFTGVFAYASTILSGWGLGTLAGRFGWDAALGGLVVIAAIGTALFAFVWPARPHGYQTTARRT
jgi:OPA family glycerol-3-phosphate transporter-like MFS transporter/OPA family sugar phosphate sensor protein UhpC-like MFS transporter